MIFLFLVLVVVVLLSSSFFVINALGTIRIMYWAIGPHVQFQ